MRVFAALAVCVLALVAAPATAQNIDITGTWDVLVTTPQGDMPSVLSLKKDGDKFVGTLSSQMGETPVEGAVKDKAVSIYFTISMNGNNLDVVFNGTIDGEAMKGTADVGGMGQMEWSARRQPGTGPSSGAPAPAAAAPKGAALDVSGTWGLEVATEAGSGTPTLTLKQDGEKLSGQYESSQFGTAQITGTLKGSAISFSFDISVQGTALHVVYTGTVEKDTMKGSVDFGGAGSGTFTGKKR